MMNGVFESSNLYTKIGYSYLANKDYDSAAIWFKKAIEKDFTNDVEIYSYLAFIANEKKDYVAAWKYVDKAYRILENAKKNADILFKCIILENRGDYAKRLGKMQEAIESYEQILNISPHLFDRQIAYDNLLYCLICLSDDDVVFQAHKYYRYLYKNVKKEKIYKFLVRYAHPKIKVAYISPDFRQHVMFSFYHAMLMQYNKQNFHVTCYQLNKESDNFTEYLKTKVDDWIYAADFSIEELAERIHNDEIDVLVDLAGHSSHSGLPVFVYRPAPIQISGVGWMETTGLNETDYFITDRFADPVGSHNLIEKKLYLDSQLCYTARNDVPIPSGAPCLAVGHVTFGVFNNYYKFNDNILELWKEIMDRVENSVLLLKCQLYISESAVKMAYERFEKLGFDVNRIQFEPATNTYMNRYLDVDIALDTYPYTGGGTTCDALYMGIPVISLYGQRRGSRFSYSILNNIGLGILTAESGEEYVEKAVALAENKDILDFLHKNIRSMMVKSPVMDSNLYMRQLEQQYKKILEKKYESVR